MNSAAHIKEEKNFYITARDGKEIFVRHASSKNNTANKAVILGHGITGNPNEYIHLYARNFFTEKGYDVYRMSFYSNGDKTRNLEDTTIQMHADDINDLIKHITPHHKKIYMCGHSYGGVSVIYANPNVSASSLWDSTFLPWEDTWQERENDITPLDEKYFLGGNGFRFVFGYDMFNEAKNTTKDMMIHKVESLTAPTQAISVEFGHEPMRDELPKYLNEPTEFKIIKGADHCFTNGDTAQDLYNTTHQWFERF